MTSQPSPVSDLIDEQPPELYRVAMQTLRFGFICAAALFVMGFVAAVVSDSQFAHEVKPIDELPGAILDREPMALLDLAFLVLIFAPVVTVLRLALTFRRLGDQKFAIVSAVVLSILMISVIVALLR